MADVDDALVTPWGDTLIWSPPQPQITALPTLEPSAPVVVPAPRAPDEVRRLTHLP